MDGNLPSAIVGLVATPQTTNEGSAQKILIDTVVYDANSMANLASNRIVVPIAGLYLLDGAVTADTGHFENLYALLYVNGAEIARGTYSDQTNASNQRRSSSICLRQLAASDYVELYVLADGAGTFDVSGSATASATRLAVSRLGD
jgi:hypothetical protein